MLESWSLLLGYGPPPPSLEPPQRPAGAPSTAELIDHVVERYHQVHRAEFPDAIRLARKVETVHAGHPDSPEGLADHLALMFDDLEAHQLREERVLFPTMLQGGCAVLKFPITRMMAEHRDVEDQLVRLRALTRDHTPPESACRTWRALCEACRKLDEDLSEHMRIENEDLFTRFAG